MKTHRRLMYWISRCFAEPWCWFPPKGLRTKPTRIVHMRQSLATLAFTAAVLLSPASRGDIYVSTGFSGIQKFTPAGVRSVFATNGLSAPAGVAFDIAGNLYAANSGNNT